MKEDKAVHERCIHVSLHVHVCVYVCSEVGAAQTTGFDGLLKKFIQISASLH